MWPRQPERCRFKPDSSYIGKKPEAYRKDHPNSPVRVIQPGNAIIMNYCKERANLEVDKHGYVTKIWFG